MNRSRSLLVALLALALALLAACGGPVELRQAQDLYNRGVEQENRAGIQAWFAGVVPATETQPPRSLSETPRTYYAACLDTLKDVDDGALERDNLLPTKRLLEALCLWRLERYRDARSAAHAAALAAENASRVLFSKDPKVLDSLSPQGLELLAPVREAIVSAKSDGQATGVAMKHLKPSGVAVDGGDVGAAVKAMRG